MTPMDIVTETLYMFLKGYPCACAATSAGYQSFFYMICVSIQNNGYWMYHLIFSHGKEKYLITSFPAFEISKRSILQYC